MNNGNLNCCHRTKNQNQEAKTTSKKSAVCNDWTSGQQNYDIAEASKRHKKTATNNQW
ncbi:hypothetical protein [Clostridium weizhouense]|uniref:Uncharacterized protein n=1 Tax=Clostridium weizhouense TaxID=2859781 RepID=A0ABS7ALX9_9CLOT|nr:hypothetical protein [Clostridium weizhouense]MBW6409421.1 hypothetical protein [Clostridium weizhouense]